MDTVSLSAEDRQAAEVLAVDLRRVFGERLQTVAAYGIEARAMHGGPLHTIALVERLTFEDLTACAPLATAWRKRHLDVPLLLELEEFQRTLDAFPLEYGDIIAHHTIIAGTDPFAGVAVSPADVRRALEQQAKSHLIHLREGFLETGGDAQRVARLIAASAPAFHTLLAGIARLAGEPDAEIGETAERQIGIPASVVAEVLSAGAGNLSTIVNPMVLLGRYIAAVERIWEFVDTWRSR